ncbi:hypothetical protein HUW51_20430 [Adhaeribacter swui]|uniref:Dihydrofolate reductase family protein n=1 Tax=Adhaeribacter swui TaxID=2086471 RepID=A0A7G7GFH1_9BACT|nr:hypothetical protein HUW51_20430 [Adhaeribacter swui]
MDTYILAFIPLVFGEGISLFPKVQKQENLVLEKSKAYPNGIVMLYLHKQPAN